MSDYVFEVVVIVLLAIPISLSCWALLDAAHRPAWAWALAGRNRVLWMALILAGVFMVPFGVIVSTIYLTRVRRHVALTEAGRVDS